MQQITATLQPGEISQVNARKEGLFVVKLLERKTAQFRDFNLVRADIIRRLHNQKFAAVEQEFLRSIQNGLPVTQYPERLAALTGLPVQTNAISPALNPSLITLHKP